MRREKTRLKKYKLKGDNTTGMLAMEMKEMKKVGKVLKSQSSESLASLIQGRDCMTSFAFLTNFLLQFSFFFFQLSTYQFIHFSICIHILLQSVYLFIYLSISELSHWYLSIYIYIYIYIYVCVCMCVYAPSTNQSLRAFPYIVH